MNTLSEEEKTELTETFHEANLFHAVQKKETLTELLSSLTEEERETVYRWLSAVQNSQKIQMELHISNNEYHDIQAAMKNRMYQKVYAVQKNEETTSQSVFFTKQIANFIKYIQTTDSNPIYARAKMHYRTASAIETAEESDDASIKSVFMVQPALHHVQSPQTAEIPEQLSEQLKFLTQKLQNQEQRLNQVILQHKKEQQSAVSLSQIQQMAEKTIRQTQRELQDAQRRNGWFS